MMISEEGNGNRQTMRKKNFLKLNDVNVTEQLFKDNIKKKKKGN